MRDMYIKCIVVFKRRKLSSVISCGNMQKPIQRQAVDLYVSSATKNTLPVLHSLKRMWNALIINWLCNLAECCNAVTNKLS